MAYISGFPLASVRMNVAGDTAPSFPQPPTCTTCLPPQLSYEPASCKSEYPPLPAHFKSEFPTAWPWARPILKFMFTSLTIVSFSHMTLEHTWRMANADSVVHREWKDRISAKISTIAVVASLFLTCVITLITTDPPVTTVFNYTQRGPYLCLCTAAAILLGGVIVASTILFATEMCSAEWCLETLMSTRIRIVIMMIFFAYPFFAIGCATVLFICGIYIAAWTSQDPVIQLGCVLLVFTPLSLAFLFIATQVGRMSRSRLESNARSHA